MKASAEWKLVEQMMLGQFLFVKDFNENHDPETGQFTSGSGGNARSYKDLLPKKSYTETDKYKETVNRFRSAFSKDDELREKQNTLEEELKKESRVKPKEEWTDEEKLDALIWGPPKVVTERGKAIKEELQQISEERVEARNERDRASDELRVMKNKAHREQMREYTPSIARPATQSEYEGFKTDSTGMSFYDSILEGKKPGYQGKLVEMSPVEYLKKCAYEIFDKATIESTIAGTDKDNVAKYKKMMKSGTKFDLPVLSYKEHAQEGRHRAIAAYELGIDTIPVLEVY